MPENSVDEASSIIYSHPSIFNIVTPQILEHIGTRNDQIQYKSMVSRVFILRWKGLYNYFFWCSPTALQLTSQHGPDRILEITTRPKWITSHGLTLSVCGSDAQGQELLVLLNSLACFISSLHISPMASILRKEKLKFLLGREVSARNQLKKTPLFALYVFVPWERMAPSFGWSFSFKTCLKYLTSSYIPWLSKTTPILW